VVGLVKSNLSVLFRNYVSLYKVWVINEGSTTYQEVMKNCNREIDLQARALLVFFRAVG
jgi:hypothetical protein